MDAGKNPANKAKAALSTLRKRWPMVAASLILAAVAAIVLAVALKGMIERLPTIMMNDIPVPCEWCGTP